MVDLAGMAVAAMADPVAEVLKDLEVQVLLDKEMLEVMEIRPIVHILAVAEAELAQ